MYKMRSLLNTAIMKRCASYKESCVSRSAGGSHFTESVLVRWSLLFFLSFWRTKRTKKKKRINNTTPQKAEATSLCSCWSVGFEVETGPNSCTGRCSHLGVKGERRGEERLHWATVVRGDTKQRVPNVRQCKADRNGTSVWHWLYIYNDLYCSPSIVRVIKSRRMRWAGHVARMEKGRGVRKVLVGKPEGKRPLGRPRRRWEDNIKMDLQEVGRGCGDWMELAQDRDRWRAFVSTVMNFRVA